MTMRFVDVIMAEEFTAFVRVSGDSPLLDQRLVDRAVDIFMAEEPDIVTNIQARTFPRGQSVEVIRSDVFLAAERLPRPPSLKKEMNERTSSLLAFKIWTCPLSRKDSNFSRSRLYAATLFFDSPFSTTI